eukprot:2873492-Pleurochrysis_carterae.AAC.1
MTITTYGLPQNGMCKAGLFFDDFFSVHNYAKSRIEYVDSPLNELPAADIPQELMNNSTSLSSLRLFSHRSRPPVPCTKHVSIRLVDSDR